MNKTEFISYIDDAIKQEMLLGSSKDERKLIGLRNIKSDFNYIASKNPKLEAYDIVMSLYKERVENVHLYLNQKRDDLWAQENTERNILRGYLPQQPSVETIVNYLNSLTDISKDKKNFKKFQDACVEKFGYKIDSKIILDFINEN